MRLLPTLLCATVLSLCSITAAARQDDGPHARYVNGDIEARWLCDGKVVQKNLKQVNGTRIEPVCGFPAPIQITEDHPFASTTTIFQAKKIAAISDIHGQYQSLKTLLQVHGIIGGANAEQKTLGDNLDWRFGDGHLVIAGDIVDRGPQVTEALWLLYRLDAQAKAAGGRVHVLLGNHETMVMANDLRYVHPKYLGVAQELGLNYPELFDTTSVIGRWLRSKAMLVQINDSLFMHAGLHPDYSKLELSLSEINEQFRLSLGFSKADIKKQTHLSFLYGSNGPIWYRGYFKAPQLAAAEFEQLLQNLKVNRLVVGHTTMSGILSHYDGKLFSIDSDIKSGKLGEILLFEDGKWQRGTLLGEKLSIPASSLDAH